MGTNKQYIHNTLFYMIVASYSYNTHYKFGVKIYLNDYSMNLIYLVVADVVVEVD